MGYNARNDEIHENLERMRRDREAYEDSLAIVRQFNTRLSAKEDRLVLADNSRRARVEASLAHHRVRCLQQRHRSRPYREASRSRRTDPRCTQRCSVPALQWSWPDAELPPLYAPTTRNQLFKVTRLRVKFQFAEEVPRCGKQAQSRFCCPSAFYFAIFLGIMGEGVSNACLNF